MMSKNNTISHCTVFLIALFILPVAARAQIPYFPSPVGDGKLNGYTSLKVRPGINAMESATTFQYGIGGYLAAGMELYTSVGSAYWGANVRGGHQFNQWFGIGGQVTASFDLHDSFRYSFTITGMFLKGAITRNGKLFWCSNTWLEITRDWECAISNNEYIGYTFTFKNSHSITPMVGLVHSWKFDKDPDLAVGAYYSLKRWNFYLWTNEWLKPNPRITLGIEFVL